jgi:hypothetical protein
VLNRRLPGITARDVLSIVPFGIIHPGDMPINLSRVGSFPGAACLKKFAVMHAPRQISLGLLGTIQSGSPPAVRLPNPAPPISWILPSSSHLQRSLTRSLFFARYDRPEKRVNTTATESTPIPTPEAIFSAVGER